MSHDLVVVGATEPTQNVIAAALRDAGVTGSVTTEADGTVLYFGPGVALQLPRRIRVASEAVRLFGVPDPNAPGPSWWIEAHTGDGDAPSENLAASIIRSIAARTVGFTVGITNAAPHPASERKDGPAVVSQSKPKVYLSEWLERQFAEATHAGRDIVLMTPPGSALTLPVTKRLTELGGQWITDTDGSYYDGFSGRLRDWNGSDFVPAVAEASRSVADSPSGFHPEFACNPQPDNAFLHVRAEAMHPASRRTRIGDFAAAVFQAVTGAPPVGWGVVEPASEPWDVAEVTAYAQARAPDTTTLVLVGTEPRAIGVLTVARSSAGVIESVEALATAEVPLSDSDCGQFAEAMHNVRCRTAVAGYHLGLRDFARTPHFSGVTVPAVAVFGPEALSQAGATQALEMAGDGAALIGTAPVQSLKVQYPAEDGAEHPLEAHAKLVRALSA